MKRPLLFVSAAAAMLFAASAAEASRVSWSIGVNVPPVATYVSSGPAWGPARYAPPAFVYEPAPVVYDAPYSGSAPYYGSYVVPRVGYYAPPVVIAPRHRYWAPPHWAPVHRTPWDRHDRWHHRVDHRR